MVIIPDTAAGTSTRRVESEVMVKVEAATLPNVTAVVPHKFLPVNESVEPAAAPCGAKPVSVGAGNRYSHVPLMLVTETFTLAFDADTAVIVLSESIEKEETGVPSRLTDVTPVKFVPSIIIVEPEIIHVPALLTAVISGSVAVLAVTVTGLNEVTCG